MYIALLGRQPALGMCELERLYGSQSISWHSDISAVIDTVDCPDVQLLGGSQKIGEVVAEFPKGNWRDVSTKIVQYYNQLWSASDHKKTLGIGAYGFPVSSREVQKTGLILKRRLKDKGVSLRLIPNSEPALNTAVSHHNKLGLSEHKVELLVIKAANGKVVVAESRGSQNISALAARDQARPKTDAFVGMLPPKLARMMVNMTVGGHQPDQAVSILDPFCGTGVLLQEALLIGYSVFGSDLSQKMVDYSQQNLAWLANHNQINGTSRVELGDAMTHRWSTTPTHVATETYLGQPFSAPPSPEKLAEVRGNCNHMISQFLKNLRSQIKDDSTLCIAVPAWRSGTGEVTHLPLVSNLEKFGYRRLPLSHVSHDQLLYFRPDQVVARELLLIAPSS